MYTFPVLHYLSSCFMFFPKTHTTIILVYGGLSLKQSVYKSLYIVTL